MFQRILVPLDGSQRAEQAIPVAVRVARTTGGSLILLQVLSAPAELLPFVAPALEPSTLSADETAGMNYLRAMAALYPDVTCEVAVRTGLAASTIAAFADTTQADAIFLTSHGQSRLVHRLLGSVAERIVHSSPVPVLMLREPLPLPAADAGGTAPDQQPFDTGDPANAPEQAAPLRLLIPLDGTPEAELALGPAAILAAALSVAGTAKLELVRVIGAGATAEERTAAEAYLQAAIARLRSKPGLPTLATDWAVGEGQDPAEVLTIVATEDAGTPQGYNLVALATPPSDRANHWPFDKLIDRLLHSTHLSLLLVHPPRSR
jgi:nucleotide-binding universal stress UspA family protein